MSYDVTIGTEWKNYTSNLAEFFHDHILIEEGGTGIQALNGLTGRQAYETLVVAFHNIRATTNRRADVNGTAAWTAMLKYDPKNYWGDFYSATLWLVELMVLCEKYPDEIVEVNY